MKFLAGYRRHGVLFTAVLAFSISLLIGFGRLADDSRRIEEDSKELIYWTASQTVLEYWRLLEALDRYTLGAREVAKDDVNSRLDVLRDRLLLHRRGALGKRLLAIEGAPETITGLTAALEDVGPMIGALEVGDRAGLAAIHDLLRPFAGPLYRVGERTNLSEQNREMEHRRETTRAYWALGALLIGIMVSGSMLIFLLIRESRRVTDSTSAARRAEAVAETAKAQLVDGIESMSGGVALFDAEDRFVVCNETYRKVFAPELGGLLVPGTRLDELLRARASRGYFLEAVGRVDAWLEERMAWHRRPDEPMVHQEPDGTWIMINEYRTRDGGTFLVRTDITEIKEREEELLDAKDQAERASRAKTDFVANISHELRTPLNAVIGFSETMLAQTFGPMGNEKYLEYAGYIRRSGEHLLDMINDILDISRIESGLMELNETETDIAAVIEDAIRLVEARAAEGRVRLNVVAEKDMPKVLADERRLRQVVVNLLSNAVKFTPENGRIDLHAGASGDGIAITVTDTGIGMETADIPTLMTPFTRGESHLTRSHEGTGLGLPLTKNLVEMHGGTLEITSCPKRGTTAVVRLPGERMIPA